MLSGTSVFKTGLGLVLRLEKKTRTEQQNADLLKLYQFDVYVHAANMGTDFNIFNFICIHIIQKGFMFHLMLGILCFYYYCKALCAVFLV